MDRHIIGMNDLAATSPDLGNKVKNLAILDGLGVRVPRGFGLPFTAYDAHVRSLHEEMLLLLEQTNGYADLAKQLHEVISSPLTNGHAVLDALNTHIAGAKYFAVRSSGEPIIGGVTAAEDSATLSLAGQYESYLMVPAAQVPTAILECYASLFAERSLERFKVFKDPKYLLSRMSVLVQEMFVADLSAVVMTRDPVEGDDCFGIESTYGACESLVDGSTQGDLHLLSRTTGEVLNTQLGSKTSLIRHTPLTNFSASNKIHEPLPDEAQMCYAASEELIGEIYELGMRIEGHFGAPQDIELVVSNGEIIVTQTRPITASK